MTARVLRSGKILRLYGERPVGNDRALRVFDAFRRARSLSELGTIEFTYQLLTQMNVDIEGWDEDLRGAGLEGVADMAAAIEAGRLVPSAEALFAAAEMVECPVGVLCGDSPMADEFYRLRRENRRLKALLAVQMGPTTEQPLLEVN